ncbi:Sodium- and chloride-dependent glycine transporter 1 [Holothuria leucospilota]|uniref:Transporter n=1 Tax=Holothuria leucospilota TaxID=206669 RepID=A0A9Q1HAP8_HOLLE|nr:Sodium- and chloride-dependent glycine transporter 1 [Holothuria leucospilota]
MVFGSEIGYSKHEDDVEQTPTNGTINGNAITQISDTGHDGSKVNETEEEREKWGSWLDFILACTGYAVGLGNVWRFPYLCHEYGGGAFLIPYLIMLFCCGLPLFFMELSLGQFASQGALTIWSICPLFTGIGYGMIIVSALVAIYYNVIIAWTVYYGIKSFSFPNLPWISCNNTWNTEFCFDEVLNTTRASARENESAAVRATEEFWNYKVHGLSDKPTIGEIGGINWHLLGCLAASWIVVGVCISKGVKSSGKVVYFTAVFPYVVLIILFFRGVTLPGARDGILYYVRPDEFQYILDAKTWYHATTQIFYSLGVSFGVLLTFSSYNKFHNNCYRDAIIVSLINCGTSIFAGFVIFSILGFMAHESGRSVKDVVDKGPGLAFIAYPEALARMPGSQFWSFLFFFMLFTLGLDSEFATMEMLITAVVDKLPQHLKKWKPLVTFGACFLGFLGGILMVTKSGLFIFTLTDTYAAGFSLIVIALTYSLIISYIYGLERFRKDIEAMIGFMPGIYWKVMWGGIITRRLSRGHRLILPGVIQVLLPLIIIGSFVFYTPAHYNEYVFPPAAEVCGWTMTLASFLVIPGYSVYAVIFKANQPSYIERLKFLTKPTKEWGPLLDKHRREAGYHVLTSTKNPTTNGATQVDRDDAHYFAYSQDIAL